MRPQLLEAARQAEPDAVGQLEPGLLAHPVHEVDQVEEPALALELGVERRVEGDASRRPSVAKTQFPSTGSRPSTSTSSGAELGTRRRGTSAVELLERRPARAPRAPRAAPRPSLRAEHRQVRLHPHLAPRRGPSSTSFTRSSSRDLVRVRRRRRRALERQPPQRLAELDARLRARARGPARRRAGPRRPPRAAPRPRRPPSGHRARCTDEGAPSQASATRFRQRWSERNGITARPRAAPARRAYQSVESAASSCVPEARAASGGCTSSRGRRGRPRTRPRAGA